MSGAEGRGEAEPPREFDRIESPEDLDQEKRVLHVAQRRFLMRTPLPEVAGGSILDEEKTYTARAPIGALVLSQKARALDNLERLFDLMIDAQGERVVAHPFAPYSFIRTAIEATATGVWLIRSDRRADRVFRALQLEYRNVMERLRFVELVATGPEVEDERAASRRIFDRLNELKDSLPPLRQRALSMPPKYTGILSAVSARDPATGGRTYAIDSPILVWKVASAFIHGSEDVIRALSDVRQLHDFENGAAAFEITPSLRMLGASASVCVDHLVEMENRYAYLATHDYAGRGVGRG